MVLSASWCSNTVVRHSAPASSGSVCHTLVISWSMRPESVTVFVTEPRPSGAGAADCMWRLTMRSVAPRTVRRLSTTWPSRVFSTTLETVLS